MQLFAVIRSKNGLPAACLAERCKHAMAIVTRVYRGTTQVTGLIDGQTAIAGASNRPGDTLLSAVNGGLTQPLWLGYGNPALAEAAAALGKDNVPGAVETLNQSHGMFCCALRGEQGGRLLFYQSLTRQCPIYIAQTDDVVAAGSSALLLGLLIRPDLKPIYDRVGLAAFINSNNIFLDRTLFEGIRLLKTNTYAVLNGTAIATAECDGTIDTLARDDAGDPNARFDALTQTFAAGTKASAGDRKSILMGLSGGKDSRLVLSGARASGIELRASTNQRFSDEADDGDVRIARQIAAAFDVTHNVDGARALDASDLTMRFSPRDLAIKTILLRDGLPAKLPRHPNHCLTEAIEAPTATGVTFSGLGGELLRGGYASLDLNWLREKPHLLDEAPSLLMRKLTGRVAYFAPEIAKTFEEEVRASIAHYSARTNSAGLLELYYLMFNIGRGGIASYREAAARQELAMPCCDNRLLRQAFANGQAHRLDERIHQEIMDRLLPGLSRIELAEYHWGRGSNRSTGRIPPVVSETARQHYPIYLQLAGDLLAELRDTILASPVLAEIVGKSALAEIFDPVKINEPGRAVLVWTMYYAALLTGNSWCQEQPAREVAVDHGRPWFNILRTYQLELTRELRNASRANADVFCATAEAASASVCTRLAERFDSHDFFPEVAARNFQQLEEFGRSLRASQKASQPIMSPRGWARRLLAKQPVLAGSGPEMKAILEQLLSQADFVLRQRLTRLDPQPNKPSAAGDDLGA